ncbi:HAD hydrolase-like protein [Fodinisporobacter ferrooxydans]|uniref:HAD hydrolase-like protein n=1 Tax=Fodinisporobacter ferrooxydans TaxID=2901836 RepID=A0ABY4CQ37_9BACL|nr:HAD hydrolase-like protein [Alicyclobacillaceae bacterium MYW30-H2]
MHRKGDWNDYFQYVLHAFPTIAAKNVVMIGDRKFDILGASELGIHSIAVAYGYGPIAELEAAKPTCLVKTVADLHGQLVR